MLMGRKQKNRYDTTGKKVSLNRAQTLGAMERGDIKDNGSFGSGRVPGPGLGTKNVHKSQGGWGKETNQALQTNNLEKG